MRPRASLQAARCRFSTSSSPESCLKSRPHRQGLRHCRDTGRPEAVGRSSPVTRPRTISTLSAPPAPPPEPCALPRHPRHPSHPTHRHPAPARRPAPPTRTVCTPRDHPTLGRPCVRRSSKLHFDLDQGRGRGVEAARRRRHGPHRPGGCSGTRGVARGPPEGARRRFQGGRAGTRKTAAGAPNTPTSGPRFVICACIAF